MNEELKTKLAQAYLILYREAMAADTTREHILPSCLFGIEG